EIRRPGARPFTDLAELPLPAYDLFEAERYFRLQERETGSRFAFISTARGCPFSCRFCTSDAEKPVRFKDIDQVIEEMAFFRDNHACMSFNFCDSTFSADRARTIALCGRISRDFPGISFIVNDSVNTVDEAVLDAYATSGCSLIRFGIESGDRDILKGMTKTLSPSKALAVFRGARSRGIATDAFVMVGFPRETEESLARTRRLISDLEPDRFTVSVLFPKPFSTLWHGLKEAGDLLEQDWDRYPAPEKLMFRHDTYASLKDIMRAKERLTGRIARDLARKKYARSAKRPTDLAGLAMGYLKTLQVLKRPVLSLCERSAFLRRNIYRLADYDRMYTQAGRPSDTVHAARVEMPGQEHHDRTPQKTVLFLMPPKPEGTPYPWYLREERHSGGDTGFCLAPAMAAAVIARVRQDLPDLRIVFRDLQLDPLSRDGLGALARGLKPDLIMAVASANLLHTERERMVLD
ncbi:radical SAM protein, partial [bacterium]|nr:radical SAM protein [bacterium]